MVHFSIHFISTGVFAIPTYDVSAKVQEKYGSDLPPKAQEVIDHVTGHTGKEHDHGYTSEKPKSAAEGTHGAKAEMPAPKAYGNEARPTPIKTTDPHPAPKPAPAETPAPTEAPEDCVESPAPVQATPAPVETAPASTVAPAVGSSYGGVPAGTSYDARQGTSVISSAAALTFSILAIMPFLV